MGGNGCNGPSSGPSSVSTADEEPRRLNVMLTVEYTISLTKDKVLKAKGQLQEIQAKNQVEAILDYQLKKVGLNNQFVGLENWIPPDAVGERSELETTNTTTVSPDQKYMSVVNSALGYSFRTVSFFIGVCALTFSAVFPVAMHV